MGRFSVQVDLANSDDLALARSSVIPGERVRRVNIRAVVDTGATRLVVPGWVVSQLGLRETGQTAVRYADGRLVERTMVGGIDLTYAGRSAVLDAVVEPERESALLGAFVMEVLDLVADCALQRLAPRDPKQIISIIE